MPSVANYVKASKLIPKHFIFMNIDSYYVTDTLLQDPLMVPEGAIAIMQVWIKEGDAVSLIQCYLNEAGERIEAASKNCGPYKTRIDNWLREVKTLS